MTEEDMLQTAQDYRRQAQKSSAHYRMCEIANRRNIAFGVPAAILSTAVGTAIFSKPNRAFAILTDKNLRKIVFIVSCDFSFAADFLQLC